MPLRLALAVRETVAGHRLGALEGGGGAPPPFQYIPGLESEVGEDEVAEQGYWYLPLDLLSGIPVPLHWRTSFHNRPQD